MVGKEGTDGEQEAKEAYQAARKDSDRAMEAAFGDKVSSALADRVIPSMTLKFYWTLLNN